MSGLLLLATTVEARADQKQECSAAYDATQALRDEGKLLDARKRALACADMRCPAFVREDCSRWLIEIDAFVPTLVFKVEDESGADIPTARVKVDGLVLSDWLGGRAVPVDPGEHLVRLEVAGMGASQQTIVVRQGEKNRKIAASFKRQSAVSAPPPPSPVNPAPKTRPSPPPAPVVLATVVAPVAPPGSGMSEPTPPVKEQIPTWAWISGGAGVAFLALGVGYGISAASAGDKANALCGGDADHCPPRNAPAAAPFVSARDDDGRVFIAMTTVGLLGIVAGALGSIVSATPITSAPKAVSVTPFVSPFGGGVGARGVF